MHNSWVTIYIQREGRHGLYLRQTWVEQEIMPKFGETEACLLGSGNGLEEGNFEGPRGREWCVKVQNPL